MKTGGRVKILLYRWAGKTVLWTRGRDGGFRRGRGGGKKRRGNQGKVTTVPA